MSRRDPAVNGTGHLITDAEAADTDQLSQVIADAFHDLAVSQWLIPDPHARKEIFPAYFRIFVTHAMDTGTVHTTTDRTAVALWLPVDQHGPQPPPDYDQRLREATGPWNARFAMFDMALEEHHPAGRSHHHLVILAVRPEQQRKGAGTALLNAHHAVLDADRLPAYLEASDLAKREIYHRHGYVDDGTAIRLLDGPLMYPMWRQPGPRVPGG